MVCQQRKYKACSLLQIIENIENSRRYRFRMEPVPSAVLYKKHIAFMPGGQRCRIPGSNPHIPPPAAGLL